MPWNFYSLWELFAHQGGNFMQAAIDRVMQTYAMMVNLTSDQEKQARAEVTGFLSAFKSKDENQLAIQGLQYLRSKS
jgi:hypothetical protein